MLKLNFILVLTAGLLATSCSPEGKKAESSGSSGNQVRVIKETYPDGRLKSTTEAIGKLRHGESREYRKDGTLETLSHYQNNRKNGPAINYYPDGKTIKTRIRYENGYKQGDAEWNFPDGSLYRLTPYEKGRINGIRKVYYEDGKLQAEIPYRNGEPGAGLKEYNADGSLKEYETRIVLTEQDRISLDNTFTLIIQLSDGNRNVDFFRGSLTDGVYMNDRLSPITAENGTGTIEYHVSKGTFKMETFNIVASARTSLGNYHILQREYHLALENKF